MDRYIFYYNLYIFIFVIYILFKMNYNFKIGFRSELVI